MVFVLKIKNRRHQRAHTHTHTHTHSHTHNYTTVFRCESRIMAHFQRCTCPRHTRVRTSFLVRVYLGSGICLKLLYSPLLTSLFTRVRMLSISSFAALHRKHCKHITNYIEKQILSCFFFTTRKMFTLLSWRSKDNKKYSHLKSLPAPLR